MSDRTVIVTGISGGLGSAIGARFAAAGDVVYGWYNTGADRAEKIGREVKKSGGDLRVSRVDLRSADDVAAAVKAIEAARGEVQVLINNAAYRPIGNFLSLSEEEWSEVLSVNLLGAVRASRAVLPGMVRRNFGRIINISGIDAIWGLGGRAHVAVSKAGLQGLTRALAVEYGHRGVTVNTLMLGSFETPRDPRLFPRWEELRKFLVDKAVVGRQGKPSEVAEWCVILASEHAAFMTGQDVHLNGGAHPLTRIPTFDLDA